MSGETQTQKPHVGFEETVKDFVASRPRRPVEGRKIAGVAAGIGNRYGLDPVVVRVALVATTVFGGVGLVLYLLGWLFFPDERDQVSAFESMIGRGYSTTSTGFTVVLIIALFPTTGWSLSGDWFGGSGILGYALAIAALYLLHRNRGQFNRPAAWTGPVPAGAEASFSMSDTTTAMPTSAAAPASWDPLAAEPKGWDLPEPRPVVEHAPPPVQPPVRQPRPKTKVGLITFGVALLTAGTGVALNMSGESYFSLQHIIGLTLGVVGLGLLIGSFVGGGRGLIGLAIPLSIVGMAITVVPFNQYQGGYGDLTDSPTTAAELKSVYQHSAGNIDLDFRNLTADHPVTVKVSNGAGNTTVLLPATADVTYSCKSNAGRSDCLTKHAQGVGQRAITGSDNGTDGAGGLQIHLEVDNGAGDVEVSRG
ncbi:Phage shock protein PspC (stress-responsive transcriptional regulator) [Amycolatopsis xylanica]|uniref:Phage shock protein PspC (Stress-responsive transcriptional regulator) n=1 Tax=Amycolatopsis xylanica TaxID=589385 RepID=A0A1H3LQ69_9PSEU|nr:PspC domain-containing protein [Amycolatopsis xylanica]SDY66513.1 Phage shock protein PspC (stress-responsive transcriptional regulator) [Amycolatopsis xylanica]